MKQHITDEQLGELSNKGKNRLRKWWKPKHGDLYYPIGRFHLGMDIKKIEESAKIRKKILGTREILDIVDKLHPSKIEKDSMPLLSIGQMIEFLEHKGGNFQIFHNIRSDNQICDWIVRGHKSQELCDALWEAVKEVLEE